MSSCMCNNLGIKVNKTWTTRTYTSTYTCACVYTHRKPTFCHTHQPTCYHVDVYVLLYVRVRVHTHHNLPAVLREGAPRVWHLANLFLHICLARDRCSLRWTPLQHRRALWARMRLHRLMNLWQPDICDMYVCMYVCAWICECREILVCMCRDTESEREVQE